MQGNHNNGMIKRIVDICMTVLLLCLMAYQVTGAQAHEWIGMGMTALVILHQILNRKWYGAVFRGRYTAYRILTTAVNILLLLSFALTAFSGMSMSGTAVPFLYGIIQVASARRIHLSLSHWSFVLMGLHLGLHVPVIEAKWRLSEKKKTALSAVFCGLAGTGLFLFLRNGMPDHLFFRVAFAFLDYEKAGAQVFLENLLMLVFWVFTGARAAEICRKPHGQGSDRKSSDSLLPLLFMMGAVLLGLVLNLAFPSEKTQGFGSASRSAPQVTASGEAVKPAAGSGEQKGRTPEKASGQVPAGSEERGEQTAKKALEQVPAGAENQDGQTEEKAQEQAPEGAEDGAAETTAEKDPAKVQDGFLRIEGGIFLMGSPESENWRIDDEMQHEVTVSPFYIDAFETTQAEYERLMGDNPSTFAGEKLPVENISWLEAAAFANAKSKEAGLTPAYTMTEEGVSWDSSADGYRLPTEAEWEYACRAGTGTPFNMEKSPDADEANFYGHYPYEIEENYFDDSSLEARPGEYRQTTVEIGSFQPNAWGLYDCHGNVNEWCWDYYGSYDPGTAVDSTGPETGTRHIYRGGGWNDFAKNMRSAYRAAGQADMKSYNLGVRLVRNAGDDRSGIVTAAEAEPETRTGSKVLIAYFSWSGNTRGVVREIQSQTGADLFEITPVHPYSTDYNTVLMEAQEDQHRQARPELSGHVDNMEEYDTILLGYPNWWASIPMPIASFLEEYDFAGKRIIPFCSHGGGRFGQSLTAIAKLAPNADLGEGLSVHYSGGSDLPAEVSAWLDENGIGR